jgi:hypothetical protein
MFRRILIAFNFFIAILAAFAALCLTVLWIRSCKVADIFCLSPPAGLRYQVMTLDGRLLFQILSGRPSTPDPFWGHGTMSLIDGRAFAPWMHGKLDIPMRWIVPGSVLVSIFHFSLLFLDRRQERRRRQTKGLCPKCRYDLRAHRPGDKCPECGTPVQAPPAQKTETSS